MRLPRDHHECQQRTQVLLMIWYSVFEITLYFSAISGRTYSKSQMVEISFQTKYHELKPEVWLFKFYSTIRHILTRSEVFIGYSKSVHQRPLVLMYD